MSDEQQAQAADDPSGPGWRDVLPDEILHPDDMVQRDNGWGRTRFPGIPAGAQRYRRRIKPQQPKAEANQMAISFGVYLPRGVIKHSAAVFGGCGDAASGTEHQQNRDPLPVQNNPVCVNSDRLEFLQACVSEVSLPGGNKTRREKEGDSWDGATIPWWARFAIGHPFAADLREASYWHDRACEESRTIEDRLYGDAMFLVLMQRAGVRGWRRWAAWLGVVVNSIFFWRRPSSGRK